MVYKETYDAIIITLDKEYTRKEADIIRNKILKIVGIGNTALALTNIEKNIVFAKEELKDVGHVWIRLNDRFAGIVEKNGVLCDGKV
jgi:hypothetical protein